MHLLTPMYWKRNTVNIYSGVTEAGNYKRYLSKIQNYIDTPKIQAKYEKKLVEERGINYSSPIYSTLPLKLG
jgi:hypothetical protein